MLRASRGTHFDDEYEATATLGRGATAAVFRCVHKVRRGREEGGKRENAPASSPSHHHPPTHHPPTQPSNTAVAVKAIDLPLTPTSARAAARTAALTELAANILLQGAPHAVELIGAVEEIEADAASSSSSIARYRILLITRLCAGGELFDDVIRKTHYSEREAALAVRALASYLASAHAAGVVHRDLKPENVLLLAREDGSDGGGGSVGGVDLVRTTTAPPPRLCRQASLAAAVGAARPCTCAHRAGLRVVDLGCAALVPKGARAVARGQRVGTPYYVAPEVVAGRGGGRPADVWALGVIAFILLSGRPPFGGADDTAVLRRVRRGAFSFRAPEWGCVSRAAKDAITAMLVAEPAKRATAADVLALPWVAAAAAAPEQPLGTATLRRLREFAASSRLHQVAALALTRTVSAAGAAQLRELLADCGESRGDDASAPPSPHAVGFLSGRTKSRLPLSRLGSSSVAGGSPRAGVEFGTPRTVAPEPPTCATCGGVLPVASPSMGPSRRSTLGGGGLSRSVSLAGDGGAAAAADDCCDAPGADADAEAALASMLPSLVPLARANTTVDADRAAELAFAALDADGDGYVCAADLVAAAAATGAPALSPADAAATIAEADADGDGRLTLTEFKAAVWCGGRGKGGGVGVASVVASSHRT